MSGNAIERQPSPSFPYVKGRGEERDNTWSHARPAFCGGLHGKNANQTFFLLLLSPIDKGVAALT